MSAIDTTDWLAGVLGVDSKWLAPLRGKLAEMQAKAEDGSASLEDILDALEAGANELPELLTRENIEPLAEEFEKAMSASVIEGASAALKNRASLSAKHLRPLLNRGAFTLPKDGWYHLVPRGEYPHTDSGLVQVIDDAALAAMVNRFQPGALVDFDHFSYDPEKSSEAAGWVDALQIRPDGLWGKIRLSDLGDTALLNGRYRFLSPVWLREDVQELGAGKVRPLRLDTAGLTNNPNMRGMFPLTNRAKPLPDNPAENQTKKTDMKQIATLLGLSADASEEAILAEVRKLKDAAGTATQTATENSELKNRVSSLLGEQITADLEAAGVKDAAVIATLTPILSTMKNRKERTSFLALMKTEKPDLEPGSDKEPLTNRAKAKNPSDRAADDANKDAAKAGLLRNRANELRTASGGKRSFAQCFAQAQAEQASQ